MAEKTTNYGLTKPTPEEFYDVQVQNENMNKIDEELKKKYDPNNKPTASDVGLGNVPNVSTNNQTPTYSDTTTLSTLSSGEKLSVAFQKIKYAITNLINHLNNKNNPHGVTVSQIGASPTGHAHDVADITGTLPISKGGTGATDAATARTNLGLKTETWTFTLEDDSTVTKKVYTG